MLREAEVLLEADERIWTLLAGRHDRASTIASCTYVHILELIGDEGLSTPITVAVAPALVLVTAESLVLLALGAGPAELLKKKKCRQLEIAKSSERKKTYGLILPFLKHPLGEVAVVSREGDFTVEALMLGGRTTYAERTANKALRLRVESSVVLLSRNDLLLQIGETVG